MQTRVANSITKRLNVSYKTNIQIGAAKIDLSGRIRLADILIKDHRGDTLFYVGQLKLKLNELEGVLVGDYHFSSLEIDQPFLSVKTYERDSVSNLKQFLHKLKRNSNKRKPFDAAIGFLSTKAARTKIVDENQATSFYAEGINARLSSLSISATTFAGQIEQLNYNSPNIENLNKLEGFFTLSNNAFSLSDFALSTPNMQLAGELKMDAPVLNAVRFVEEGKLSLDLTQGWISTALFNTASNQLPKERIRFSGEAKGSLSALDVNLNIQTDHKSRFEGDLKLFYNKKAGVSLKAEAFKVQLTPTDIARYSKNLLPKTHPLHQFKFNNVSIAGGFDFKNNQSLTSSLSLMINQAAVKTSVAFKKQDDRWEFSQELWFNQLGKGDFFRSFPSLEITKGNAKVEGSLFQRKIDALEWASQFDLVQWNGALFEGLTIEGAKNEQQLALTLKAKDPRARFNIALTQELDNSEKPFVLKSAIDRLDLSSFGWAPPKENVFLATHLAFTGTQNALKEITVEKTVIENKRTISTFNDFSLFFTNTDGVNKVIQQGSDLFQFSLEGKFNYQNLPKLIDGAIREALLLPINNTIETEQGFVFDLILNKKTLKALYPAVETPNNISLNGRISSLKGGSSLSLDLPYISYGGYDIEDLSLRSSAKNENVFTRFTARKLSGKNMNISRVSLVTEEQQNKLQGVLKGSFGQKDINDFRVDFAYAQTLGKAVFELNQLKVHLEGDLWQLSENSSNQLIYDQGLKVFSIAELAVATPGQSIAIEGLFQSKNDFSFALKTEMLSLEKILPKSEKFNFKGALSSQFSIVQGEEQQLLQADIDIASFVVNGTAMGDFALVAGGSSQLKTYQIETTLSKEGKNTLKGVGNIFMQDTAPKLDLDLQLQDLALSFLSALGKDKLTDVSGTLNGDLNLWGTFGDLKLRGEGALNQFGVYIPSINARYVFGKNTEIDFRDRLIHFNNAILKEQSSNTVASLNGNLSHVNFDAWAMDLQLKSDRFLVYDKPEDENALFYGHGYLNGEARFMGPTKSLTLEVIGSTSEGTTLVIPWQEDKGLSDTSFIDYLSKGAGVQEKVTADISAVDEAFRGFEMIFDLDVNRNAEVEIVVDQSSGSTLSGKGSGNILIETNIDGKFNIWGDFIAYEGIYNFKNLGLIDKKFEVEQGGTIVWEGDPLEAQLNIEATYQVPGGANPALLVDNPNFNRKIPTNVGIQLVGNLIKPDDPVFDISFPNTTGIVVSEINYRLADQQRRQLQAISLLSQGIFISDVSVSLQGITNNLYEKASDVFSTLLGSNEGKLNVGLNYLQGEENSTIDLRTEDRIGLTLSTQISDRILINGKIGVPVDGVEQSVIVGDVQIDFILNESGSLKAKVFNRENDFRYLGDEIGYTQGMGMSYQVDFNTFQELLQKITSKASKTKAYNPIQLDTAGIDFRNKEN